MYLINRLFHLSILVHVKWNVFRAHFAVCRSKTRKINTPNEKRWLAYIERYCLNGLLFGFSITCEWNKNVDTFSPWCLKKIILKVSCLIYQRIENIFECTLLKSDVTNYLYFNFKYNNADPANFVPPVKECHNNF